MLNRKVAPILKPLENISFLNPVKEVLSNDIPFYYLNSGSQEVISIELFFQAGAYYQTKKLQAFFTAKALKEGTLNFTAKEIADKIDFYGAHIEIEAEKDISIIHLICLSKYLHEILPLFVDIINNPIFNEHEVNTIIQNERQQYLTNCQKVNFVARTQFNSFIFGSNHPYGQFANINDYDNIDRNDLILFHKERYHAGNCKIIAAGRFEMKHIELIKANLSQINALQNNNSNKSIIAEPNVKYIHEIILKNSLQYAVRIGKVALNKQHEDYFGMQVLNTVLGGYFGSRLMKNIREEKGYTYGIGSFILSLKREAVLIISTEVGNEYLNSTIDEIFKEILHLQNTLVENTELNTVKNYMLGQFVRSIDGPFAQAEKFKEVEEFGLDFNHYYQFMDKIKTITPDELQALAIKYFDINTFYQLTVGSHNE